MKTKNLVIPVVTVLALLVISPYLIHPAEAHILKTFQNVSVKIGWLHEPPLVGDVNELDVYVYNGTDDTAPPIANTAMSNMNVVIQYGGQTKPLSFDPSDDTPGLYTSALTPDALGTYNVIISGTINGTTIPSTTYPMQLVEAKDKYEFPPSSGNLAQMNMSGNMAGMNMTGGNMTGMNMNSTSNNQIVPEFGPIAPLVLVFAIISVVLVTGKTRGFLKF